MKLALASCLVALLACIPLYMRGTLSATTWRVREQPYFGWTHRAIDTLFFWQPNHCAIQQAREAHYGSTWAAWLAGWNGR